MSAVFDDIAAAPPTDDLRALAWVHGELRKSLETAHKALRRYVKEAESLGGSDVDAVDPAVLRTARVHLHQGVGALELVGMPAPAQLLRACEAAVQRMVARPSVADSAAVTTIEQASFALLDYVSRQLAGKPVSPVALFPQYRAAQQLAGADRVHPADLWPQDWDWHDLPRDPAATPRAPDNGAREAMESLVLALMRSPDRNLLLRMSDLCADLGAGNQGRVATLWQLAAAFFEAQGHGLLATDVYTKRIASRLLALLRAAVKGQNELSDRLAQDLVFFCAHAKAAPAAPRLAAVQRAWGLDEGVSLDYETPRLGRYDPAWISQAKKRVAVAKDAWAAVAGGELHRLNALAEQFALVGDSLQRLFPRGQLLAAALQTAVGQTVAAAAAPPAPLAMEIATSILYLDASLEDGDLDEPGLPQRVERMARRIDDVRIGATPEPLEAWMEELYRRVSDRQTMGSVVQELRAALSEVEKQIDQYFRDPAQRQVLIPVPGQLSAMRGVLSVLGMEQASQAVLHMRDDVDALAQTEVDPQRAVQAGTFDRLADNLGALSFLIDMISVQPALAKSLFRFDPATGSLAAVMGQSERPSAFAAFDEAAPAPAAPAAVAPAAGELDDDDEMRDVFIEEAREVVQAARTSLERLSEHPDDAGEMTAVRRAFHTLKGSSRMVGLKDFGDAAWAAEQLYNARLAHAARMDHALRGFSDEALAYLAGWTEAIAAGRDDGHSAADVARAADALRNDGRRLPIVAPGTADVETDVAAPAEAPAIPSLAERVPDLPSAADLELAPPPAAEPEPEATDLDPGTADFQLDLGAFDEPAPAPEPAPSEPLLLEAAPELPEPVTADWPDEVPPAVEAVELDFGDFELATAEAEPVAEPEAVVEAKPEAAVEPAAEAAAEPEPEPADEPVKVIGDLRIGIPLFNIFLNEADELSRRLGTEIAEWGLESDRHPVPDSAVALAHSLAGNSATVGYADLSALARALEHALMRSHAHGRGQAGEPQLFTDAADEIRRLLHQFAAGFLRPVDPGLLQRLAEHERLPGPPAPPPPRPDTAPPVHAPVALDELLDDDDIDAVDAVDPELFPIFEEEADELLPQLHARLRDWADAPADAGSAAACMRTLHTFKGGARLAGAMRVGEMAHQLETAIERLSAAPESVQTADIEPLLARADAMAAAFDALRRRPAQLADAVPAVVAPVPTPAAPAAAEPAVWTPPAPEPVETMPTVAEPAVPEWAAPEPAAAEPVEPMPTAAEPVEPMPTAAEPAVPEPAATRPLVAEPAVPGAAGTVPAPQPLVPAPAPESPPAAVAAEPGTARAVPAGAIDWSRFAGTEAPAAAAPDRAAPAGNAVVRVRGGLLDRLVNQAGEVSITRERIGADVRGLQSSLNDLTDSLDRMRRQLRDIELHAETQMSSRMEAAKAASEAFDPLEMDRFTRFQELTRFMAESVNDVATLQRGLQRTLQSTEDELAAQARLTRELQDDLLRTRMVEFESTADRLYRTVRQAAKETHKQVRLDIEGGAIEIDRGVLDRMTGPFEHLLRNSVVHGIESAADRAAAGKDATGTITVAVTQEGNEVGVEVRDDGAGLNLPRIRDRAVERGLLAADAQASDADLAELIYSPGFSTASSVTELAGRGVGLDVVRAEVDAMGGRIRTDSRPGAGTAFRLLLPLTTAVTQVVMLRAGVLTVAVPSTLIEVVRRAGRDELDTAYAGGEVAHDGASVPFYWLGALLQSGARGDAAAGRTEPLVVVRSAAQRVALHVDEVVGNQEVVVKNVGPQLSRLPGLAGVTLLPSGAVALIYNPVALATLYGAAARDRQRAGNDAAPQPDAVSMPSRAPLVLVVDDSLTVRRVTQRLLLREGYRVATAKDGLDALERLAAEKPAVMLSDIEMPRMDGFDLARNVRADPRLADLPVIMITSRIAQKHREHAAALGVDHYLGKPFSEDELLALVARYAGADIRI